MVPARALGLAAQVLEPPIVVWLTATPGFGAVVGTLINLDDQFALRIGTFEFFHRRFHFR